MTTYDDLISYAPVAAYASNRNTVDELPGLVRRAQSYVTERLDHDLFAGDLEDVVIGTDGYVHPEMLPETFLELRYLAIEARSNSFRPLHPRAENMLEALYAAGPAGVPIYYARIKDRLYRVYPQPFRPLNARLRANAAPPMLSPAVQTNILTERFPEVVEMSLLRQVAIYNVDEPLTQRYTEELTGLLGAANRQVSRLARDETAQRPVDTRNVQGS